MAYSKGSSNIKNTINSGKHSLLPPKCPFPTISPSYADYVPSVPLGSKGMEKTREGNSHHQRTSSESVLMEEQPSWLDELLNEPETPVRRGGHRRSSSDSFAYLDAYNATNVEYRAQDEHKIRNITSVPSWGSLDPDRYGDAQHASFYMEPNSSGKQRIHPWDSSWNSTAHSSANSMLQSSRSSCALNKADGVPSVATVKQNSIEAEPHDAKAASERKDCSHAKPSTSETDTKRAKQQFAQRSRVRKLRYIAELESNVQALQAEGSEISADLEFLNQQHLILNMENKALKQRLDSLAQEKLIKYLEHEVLEREIGRLRAMYQQKQQPQQELQQQPSNHRRTRSSDLDSKLANLSLKHKDTSSGCDFWPTSHLNS